MMWCRFFALVAFLLTTGLPAAEDPSPLPGTKPLTMIGDIARRLAESGCRVLVPTLIDRGVPQHRHLDWPEPPR